MALSLVGCFFVVRAFDVNSLDAIGVLAAFAAMLTFAIYVVGSERSGERHEAVTTLFWAFGFATPFWALVTPWWAFPWEGLASTRNALLAVALVIAGTLVPFVLTVSALRHVPAPRVAVIATLEPVLAAVQIAGGMIVLTAVRVGAEPAPRSRGRERSANAPRSQIFSALSRARGPHGSFVPA